MEIINNAEQHRFELEFNDNLAFLTYSDVMGNFCINHTEVPETLKGKGMGSKLVRHAMDYAKNENKKVYPFCPFAASYILKNDTLVEQVGKGFKWNNI
jgi:predicted GNAT family acetyltransferase